MKFDYPFQMFTTVIHSWQAATTSSQAQLQVPLCKTKWYKTQTTLKLTHFWKAKMVLSHHY